MNSIRVGILIFQDVEILDFCGPYEVLTAVRLNDDNGRIEASPFEVVLVAESLKAVRAKGGLRVLPNATLETCPKLDWLLIPGGWGVRKEISNPRIIAWIAQRAQTASLTASVCTGAMLLGKAGLLNGKRATTHIASIHWMRELFPDVTVEEAFRWVEDGKFITAAGVSAGIDMSLHLVERTFGRQVAESTANQMEYYTSFSENRWRN